MDAHQLMRTPPTVLSHRETGGLLQAISQNRGNGLTWGFGESSCLTCPDFPCFGMATSATSAEAVRVAEARIASDRKHANELVELIELCVTRAAQPAARLAAMQACRSLFSSWAISGDLQLRPTEEDMAGDGSAAEPLAVYRAWLFRSYRKLLSALSATLSDSRTPLALALPALDSLVMLAAVEARHSRAGRVDPSMLDAAHGAYRLTLDALIHARTAPSQEVLERLRSAHLTHLDASFYLLSHVRRLARAEEAPPPKRVERLLTLLLLVKPPSKDVAPRAALMLAAPPLPTKLKGKRARASAAKEAEAGGGGSNSERAAELREWPPEAKQLLGKQRHRAAYDKAWRALLALPMPAPAFRQVLRALLTLTLTAFRQPNPNPNRISSGATCTSRGNPAARARAAALLRRPLRRVRARRRRGSAGAARAVCADDAPSPRVPAFI